MIKLTIDQSGMPAKAQALPKNERPFFHDLAPDFSEIEAFSRKYQRFRTLIVIGNGGAVNSFCALNKSLYTGDKKVIVINSMEPDLIKAIKTRALKRDTLVIVASTSGINVGVLEIMSQFQDYRLIVLTAQNKAALHSITEQGELPHIYVPYVCDRFQTSSALTYLPLALLGLDARKIDTALHAGYDAYAQPGNDAHLLSSALWSLERRGYTEVYMPIYSHRLEGFSIYLTQLMHESVCKNGRGQSFLVVAAPESQHHSNQLFFSGRKSMCGAFVRIEQQTDTESKTIYNDSLKPIVLRDGRISDIVGVPLARAFEFEFRATYRDALDNKIPTAAVSVGTINEESLGRFIAFWHYVAVYSSWLRGVNPFDQPQVEKSKELAFEMRRKYSRQKPI